MTVSIIIALLVFLAFTWLHASNTLRLKNHLRRHHPAVYKSLNLDNPMLMYRPFIGMKQAKQFISTSQYQDLHDTTVNTLISKIRLGTVLANLSIIMVILLAILDAINK